MMNTQKTSSSVILRVQKFTLLELLIVVAIIAILAGILLPALTSALNKSRAIHCLSGMKQLGLAAQNYLDNNNDTIAMMQGWTKIYYLNTTAGYVDLTSIARDAAGLKAPVCKKDKNNNGLYAWVPQKYVCSVITQVVQHAYTVANDSNLKDVSLCSFDSNYNCSGHLQYYWYYGILMGQTYSCLVDSSNNYYHKTSRLRQASGSVFWAEGAPQIQKPSALGRLSVNPAKTGFRRHFDRTNVLFFDGHAGSVGLNQTICDHTPNSTTVKTCASCRFWAPYYGR